MNDAERLRTYLRGWDDALECFMETMSWVPDEHVVGVVRRRRNEMSDAGRHPQVTTEQQPNKETP